MNNLFQYVPGNSVIHRLNPVTKLLLAIVICIAAFLSGNLVYLAALLVVDLLIGSQSSCLCCRSCWCGAAHRYSGLLPMRAC